MYPCDAGILMLCGCLPSAFDRPPFFAALVPRVFVLASSRLAVFRHDCVQQKSRAAQAQDAWQPLHDIVARHLRGQVGHKQRSVKQSESQLACFAAEWASSRGLQFFDWRAMASDSELWERVLHRQIAPTLELWFASCRLAAALERYPCVRPRDGVWRHLWPSGPGLNSRGGCGFRLEAFPRIPSKCKKR